MRITEVRVTLVGDGSQEGLLAYCAVSFDSQFVVHDIKLLRLNERLLVSMPSRRITSRCESCRESNHMRAVYCNRCGIRFERPLQPKFEPHMEQRIEKTKYKESAFYIDIAHPATREFRTTIEEAVILAHKKERARVAVAPNQAVVTQNAS